MATETALDFINRQPWIDPLADQVQEGVHNAFESAGQAGQAVKNALHGTWLGHPLHAILTDVPVGAWTAALVCDAIQDMTASKGAGQAADLAVAIGLAGAVGAALTGVTDWSDTDGRARKIGLVHGLLNLCGTGLYAASLVCRNQQKRNLGRGLAYLGYAVAGASAYLGGELVYSEKVGVNHASSPALPKDFALALPESELSGEALRKGNANGVPVLLSRVNGEICAIADTCSHLGGPLSEGTREGDTVTCPWHRSRFDLKTGRVIDGPATHGQPCLETRVRDGQIEVRYK